MTAVSQRRRFTVPVLVLNGEIDVCPDPGAEPTAYRSSFDVTTVVVPRTAHMHIFSGARYLVWERLDAWYRTVAATKRARMRMRPHYEQHNKVY